MCKHKLQPLSKGWIYLLTHRYVSGCAKEGVEQDRVEGGVETIHWRHSSQHRIGQTWGKRAEGDVNKQSSPRSKVIATQSQSSRDMKTKTVWSWKLLHESQQLVFRVSGQLCVQCICKGSWSSDLVGAAQLLCWDPRQRLKTSILWPGKKAAMLELEGN